MKSKKLKKGDKIAIVSLSRGALGEPYCAHQVELGTRRLQELGLEVIFMDNALKGVEFLANNPEARAQDLKDTFKDDSINAILCAIGGMDTYKLLPYLMNDEEFISNVKNNPKIFIGFSDTTNNHFMFHKLGLNTFYGLNYLGDIAELDTNMLPHTLKNFNKLFSNDTINKIESSPIWYDERTDFSAKSLGTPRVQHNEVNGYEVINGNGVIKGKLFGGCIESIYDMLSGENSMVQKSMYQEYGIIPSLDVWKDLILFIETSERRSTPEKYEIMINALKEHGILGSIKGLIVGKPQNEIYYNEYKEILTKFSKELNVPTLYNVNFGHALPRTIIPYGIMTEIDFDSKTITTIEKWFEE